jgi:hypothetical protein
MTGRRRPAVASMFRCDRCERLGAFHRGPCVPVPVQVKRRSKRTTASAPALPTASASESPDAFDARARQARDLV